MAEYEPGAVRRSPDGETATKTTLDDARLGSWIVVNPQTGWVRHASTADVKGWKNL